MKQKLKALTAGPIIGETLPDRTRVWGRADREMRGSRPARAFGVARIAAPSGSFRQPIFFKMNPNFDMTGIGIFENLKPETEYTYQMGWFFADFELEALSPDLELDWLEASSGKFRTAAADPTRPRSILFGSCRYLLRLFGGSFFDDRGDKTFRSMLGLLEAPNPPNLLMLGGDQIYADDLNVIGADARLEHFFERYRAVFTQPFIQQVLSRVPTYMMLDDHEIEDNWPASATEKDWVTKYPIAIHAYMTYQGGHSPLLGVEEGRLDGVPEKLWYTFSDGCCDFFVADTRTERVLAEPGETRKILNSIQMRGLKNWLADGSLRVKLIVSAVPVFPDAKHLSDDKWSGFLDQRLEMLDFIRAQGIRRVAFLSGDVHAAMSAELRCAADPNFLVLSIISSSLFWPYPHPRRGQFQLEGDLAGTNELYQVHNASNVVRTDNFARLTVDLAGVDIEIFDRKGNLEDQRRLDF
jgi:alkaline phosphatase D